MNSLLQALQGWPVGVALGNMGVGSHEREEGDSRFSTKKS